MSIGVLASAMTLACGDSSPSTTTDAGSSTTTPDAGTTSGGNDAGTTAAVTCSSNTHWTRGDRGSSVMHPGRACVSCHQENGGPSLAVGGTVFPTYHEEDDCNGLAGATVVITDNNGTQHTFTTNSAGNFYQESFTQYAFPIRAEVHYNGKVQAMVSPQTSADCNSCHTQDGANAAPGRITAPQ